MTWILEISFFPQNFKIYTPVVIFLSWVEIYHFWLNLDLFPREKIKKTNVGKWNSVIETKDKSNGGLNLILSSKLC